MTEHNKHSNKKKNEDYYTINKKTIYYIIGAIALIVIGFYAWGFIDDMDTAGNETVDDSTANPGLVQLTVLSDDRCANCNSLADQILTGTQQQIFPNTEFKVTKVDYNSEEGKAIYNTYQLSALPALIFDEGITEAGEFADVVGALVKKEDGSYAISPGAIGASFDPNSEICDNNIDDTGDGKIDCEADECKSQWKCVDKSDKPVVELFVMSHCPYGTQMEKGILPVAKLLGDKIDFQLKFVNYAMHGQKEIDEQVNQYCINEEYPDKLLDYLECFLAKTGSAVDGETCMTELEIDSATIESCVETADEEFGLTAGFEDKTQWKGSFPPFNIHNTDNIKYGVRGSPTLIINGASPSAGRDSASILDAVCFAFTEEPKECSTKLSSATPSPGFGIGTATTDNLAACGG